jgi:hypothetical protein
VKYQGPIKGDSNTNMLFFRFLRASALGCIVAISPIVAISSIVAISPIVTIAAPLTFQSKSRVVIRGALKDDHGDVIVAAKVTLTGTGGPAIETTTDEHGRFQFEDIPAGTYTFQAAVEGFGPFNQQIHVEPDKPPTNLEVTLHPVVTESIKVDAEQNNVSLDPETAGGAQVLKQKDLEALPDDPDDLMTQLQEMATSSGSAPGQALVTVDGFINDGRLPPKSSIREVRINPDLYSAEYYTPPYQGGRIEIFTKPGAEQFHGQGFFIFDDSALNAREVFAPTKLSADTKQYGFQLGGPIVPKRAGFLIDVQARDINQLAVVDAITLGTAFQPSAFSTSLLAPRELWIASARVDWQATPSTALTLRDDYNRDKLDNQGVGGFTLAEGAYNSTVVSNAIRMSANTIVSPHMTNEARLSLTSQEVNQEPASDATQIQVVGAFSSGGAPTQSLRHREWDLEFDDNVVLIRGSHNIKMGIQLLGKSISDASFGGFNGSYLFGGELAPELDANGNVIIGPNGPIMIPVSGLEQYRRTLLELPGGVPTSFSITTGNPAVRVEPWTISPFIQDEWRLKKNLALSLGMRYEAQTTPTEALGFAPRIGVAYSPDKAQRWVLRARAGLFYNRIDSALTIQAERLDGIREQQVLITAPPFPNALSAFSSNQSIPTITRLSPDLRPPSSMQAQVGVEHQLPRGWRVQANYNLAWSWADLFSQNINAPTIAGGANPESAPRPLGIAENIIEFESGARLKGHVIFAGANQSASKHFTLFFGYLYMNFRTDSDGASFLPQNSYDLDAEWARPSWQTENRVFGVLMLNLPYQLRLSSNLNASSGAPLNIVTGFDNNGDGSYTDRPSFSVAGAPGAVVTPLGVFNPNVLNGDVPRNFATNPTTIGLDLNASRTFVLHGKTGSTDRSYRLTLNARASNVLNHTNVTSLTGAVSSPFFDLPNSAGPSRHIELGARFIF